jgi:hypothetical protein
VRLPTHSLLALLRSAQAISLAGLLCCAAFLAHAQDKSLDDLLALTGKQVASFVDQFSEVKSTEHVTQEKLKANNRPERRADSIYDYLVILTNTGGELSLDESRLAVQQAKADKNQNKPPLLVSNGFATLFLIFHPYYAASFKFSPIGDETIAGRRLTKIRFEHIRNTRSVAALALRGRDYPLDFSGIAWIDSSTGLIARIVAGIDSGIEDLGMKSFHSEVEFAPVRFGGKDSAYWFPSQATVEVETLRQHWRNTHRFYDYKRFSVSTEEQVAKQ